MQLRESDYMPIYVQIAKWLENKIINEELKPNEKVYSQYQLASMLNVNPATAAKGIKLLVDESILYKKRGIGTFVSADAKTIINNNKKDIYIKNIIISLISEAERLDINDFELFEMIKNTKRELEIKD